jgi:putative transposase
VVTPAARRNAVARLKNAFGMSERQACQAIGCCRMTVRYATTRADDRDPRDRMKAIAQERRFGYRRLIVMLEREGDVVNHKKLFRLYREEKLAVRRRSAPNERWSLDSVSRGAETVNKRQTFFLG